MSVSFNQQSKHKKSSISRESPHSAKQGSTFGHLEKVGKESQEPQDNQLSS